MWSVPGPKATWLKSFLRWSTWGQERTGTCAPLPTTRWRIQKKMLPWSRSPLTSWGYSCIKSVAALAVGKLVNLKRKNIEGFFRNTKKRFTYTSHVQDVDMRRLLYAVVLKGHWPGEFSLTGRFGDIFWCPLATGINGAHSRPRQPISALLTSSRLKWERTRSILTFSLTHPRPVALFSSQLSVNYNETDIILETYR